MSQRPEKYDFRLIEQKWLERWEKADLYRAVDFAQKPKKYTLFEFPYPSGERLHVGHAFTLTGTDVLARFKRMQGFNVLCPMGWDAFGLPAENYAIKTGINPMITTAENIASSRLQAKRWALSIDWSREVATTDPRYYRWTQWIFLQWYKRGLAYKQEMPINWCPSCRTGLANEEVVAGKCERCGAEVSRRNIRQWVVRITKYADRLIDGLKHTDFIEKVKAAQVNWIGRSEGITIDYPLADKNGVVSCYSTRPDTNFGTTFIVVAPEHPRLAGLTTLENKKAVEEYVKQAGRKTDLDRTDLSKEKTGVFTGSYALNRLSGKKMPIWVADFAVLSSGTGMVVGVPAHDQRDWEFARKYHLEILPVIRPKARAWDYNQGPFLDIDEAEVFNSDFLNGLPALKAKEVVTNYLVEKGWGRRAVNYHLRDWIFSRQHYWGEPIPMIFCPKCGEVPVAEDRLPVELPKVEKYQPTETGESPLAAIAEWVNVGCPRCAGPAQRETDTMPNWAGSDWYFLRYLDPGNDQALLDLEKAKYWLPVDVYVGGDEHNTLHLLYSRFTYQFLNDLGAVPKEIPEPYYRRVSHGVILGTDGRRMSKSHGNVINPDEVVADFGADAMRLYLMFMGPYEGTFAWSQESLEGCYRFLKRVWNLATTADGLQTTGDGSRKAVDRKLHQTIKKVTEDIKEMKFNTAIAALMELLNEMTRGGRGREVGREATESFLQLLAPFAPFITEELWERLGNKFSVHQSPWPKYDSKLTEEDEMTIVVQVNGKVRDQFSIFPASPRKEEVEKIARERAKIKPHLAKGVKKVVFVPGRLINFVV